MFLDTSISENYFDSFSFMGKKEYFYKYKNFIIPYISISIHGIYWSTLKNFISVYLDGIL